MSETQQSTTKDEASKRSAARVRDNQRRARERHKAYFQDLQRKVSEYEKQGVQATLDMQQAARRVAMENDRLRMLLRQKGVDDYEVAAFLGEFEQHNGAADKRREGKCGKMDAADGTVSQKISGTGTARKSSAALQPLPAEFTSLQQDGLAMLANVSAQQKCCNGQTQCADTNEEQARDANGITQSTAAQETANPASTQPQVINDDLSASTTMSCLAAARIVADLQGHGDSERARASLGCCDEGECTVKNTAVFQVMDSG